MGNIDRQLPSVAVYLGIMLMAVMIVGVICCIARDITAMSVIWNAADKGHRKKPRNREPEEKNEEEKADLRRRKKHGVNLQETDLRRPYLEGIGHDNHTGSAQNTLQREGYPNALPCGTEG